MSKKEIKQYLRNQIDSSIKTQSETLNHIYDLYYNKNYVRALKFSKITGKPINNENFKGGDIIFSFNIAIKIFWLCGMIEDYLNENYSIIYNEHIEILKEVLNEYEEYKDYNVW